METNLIDAYLSNLESDRKLALERVIEQFKNNLPSGFELGIQYKMPTYFISHQDYQAGYHCDPKLPLPFISFAATKSHLAVYHMGLYAIPDLLEWFAEAFVAETGKKPDMGKSCIRFKKLDEIPFQLLGELASKMTPSDWISVYEQNFRKTS